MNTNDKKCLVFPDMESLRRVVNVINEASYALKDNDKVIAKSSISEALLGAFGAGTGTASSLAALYGLGTTGFSASGITSGLAAASLGAGMLAGMAVLAVPIATLAGLGVYMTPEINSKLLHQEKEHLHKKALEKYEAVTKVIKKEINSTKERKEYLQSLSILLAQLIKNLENDLKAEG